MLFCPPSPVWHNNSWLVGTRQQVTGAVNGPNRLFVSLRATTGLTVMLSVLFWIVYLSAGWACRAQIFKPANHRTPLDNTAGRGMKAQRVNPAHSVYGQGWPGISFLILLKVRRGGGSARQCFSTITPRSEETPLVERRGSVIQGLSISSCVIFSK